MADVDRDLIRLRDLSPLADDVAFDQMLGTLAQLAARTIGASQCSILLADGEDQKNAVMRVYANYGVMAPEAFKESVVQHQGIAGEVAATGKAILIEDVHNSKFASLARRPTNAPRSLISAPIMVGARVIGVVNLSEPEPGRPFDATSLRLVEVLTVLIAKSLHLAQAQAILKSRFARIALANEASATIEGSLDAILQSPDQVAKIMAKSFYKEMAKAGFGNRQIINAASEIINQLSRNIQRHSRRIVQSGPPSED
ncbi:MAG: hypothetical protein NVSMB6_03790 [Burkholderiaceae bacterium]